MVRLEPGNQALAYVAAQIEGGGRVGRAHQRPDFDGPLGGVGHLEHGDAVIPLRRLGHDPLELAAQVVEGNSIVEVEDRTAQDVGGGAGPVLEGMLDEVRDRQDHSPRIPDAHDDIGERDLFDPAPLAFDHDDVVEAYRFADRDLDAGHEVAEGGAGGGPGRQPDDAGRSQEARTQRLRL